MAKKHEHQPHVFTFPSKKAQSLFADQMAVDGWKVTMAQRTEYDVTISRKEYPRKKK